jgi:tetrahydromethanopterin S-methyltransferase subunit E
VSFIPTPLAAIAGLIALVVVEQATGNPTAAAAVGVGVAVVVFAWALTSDAVPSEHAGM